MSTFAEILPTLPACDHIARLELLPAGNTAVEAVIENKPGQAGSVRVYHALLKKFGGIDRAAAEEGLCLYAEHSADARIHPGKHPNIDRLLRVIEQDLRYDVRIVSN